MGVVFQISRDVPVRLMFPLGQNKYTERRRGFQFNDALIYSLRLRSYGFDPDRGDAFFSERPGAAGWRTAQQNCSVSYSSSADNI
jgi:hypothetical protein